MCLGIIEYVLKTGIASLTPSPYACSDPIYRTMSSSAIADIQQSAAEMFGRRKLQIVLDISRVSDIKVISVFRATLRLLLL